MTCWAPVCVSIRICDCAQIQGGRHSGILRRPLVLADWGCFMCWLAEIQRTLSPCPLDAHRESCSSQFSSSSRRAGEGLFTGGAMQSSAEPEPASAGGHVCVSPLSE